MTELLLKAAAIGAYRFRLSVAVAIVVALGPFLAAADRNSHREHSERQPVGEGSGKRIVGHANSNQSDRSRNHV